MSEEKVLNGENNNPTFKAGHPVWVKLIVDELPVDLRGVVYNNRVVKGIQFYAVTVATREGIIFAKESTLEAILS